MPFGAGSCCSRSTGRRGGGRSPRAARSSARRAGRRTAATSPSCGTAAAGAQLWVREAAAAGPGRRLTDHPRGVSEPAWSPDGRRIAFIAAGADRAGGEVEAEEQDPRRRVIRVRGHRHKLEGVGWLDGPLPHVWVVDLRWRQ